MATQEVPIERTWASRKYTVLLELYNRIYADFFIDRLGSKQNLLSKALTIKDALNSSQQTLLDKGIDGVDEWDVTLFWDIQWRGNISIRDQLTYLYLKTMKDSRNLAMHDIKFKMTSAEADHFFKDAKILAKHFDDRLKPTKLYSKQLDDIKDMTISPERESEIREKIIAEALLVVVKKDSGIVIHVGKDFRIDEDVEKVKITLVIQEENNDLTQKIIKWFALFGQRFKNDDIIITYVTSKGGSIIVEIFISTSASKLKKEKIYDAIAAYIRQAYCECKIELTSPIDVVLFTSDEENYKIATNC